MAEKNRLETLDAIRGVAALCVVVWHWQHLLLLQGRKLTWPPLQDPDRRVEPAYFLLKPLYEHGFLAVDLFFVISGFVFFYLYRAPIAARRTSAFDFSRLRFSRLYPLHFVTLIIVALLQVLFFTRLGQPFVYDHNDAVHFLKNLLFVNVPDTAFNGPTWSLSVEIVMYALFWALARFRILNGYIWSIALALLGFAMQRLFAAPLINQLGHGLAGFFCGGLVFQVFEILKSRRERAPNHRILGHAIYAATVLGWIAAIAIAMQGPALFAFLLHRAPPQGLTTLLCYGLFPLTVLAAALWDAERTRKIIGFEWLGSISYSSYLLHFPLQLMFALAVAFGLAPRSIAEHGVFFAAYFATLLVISTLSYRYFERPLQQWLRLPFQKPAIAVAQEHKPSV